MCQFGNFFFFLEKDYFGDKTLISPLSFAKKMPHEINHLHIVGAWNPFLLLQNFLKSFTITNCYDDDDDDDAPLLSLRDHSILFDLLLV